MEVFHLSHTDLDGYGCQYLSSNFFDNITYSNSNYGAEIGAKLNNIFKQIEDSKNSDFLVLISDLNLSLNEANLLTKRVEKSTKSVEILLLDHHGSGEECAKIHSWYRLDTNRCASKIVWEYLNENYNIRDTKRKDTLQKLVDSINSYDIWRESEYGFEFGKVCAKALNDARELNRFMFDNQSREFRFYILNRALEFIDKSHGHIELDSSVYAIKKSYLLTNQKDNTLENLTSNYLISLLEQIKDEITIYYNGHKGILTYSIGSISVLANGFLKNNSEFDFFMDISPKGALSIRASGAIDVAYMSRELFGGGGHPNAAGGKCEGFKESFLYSEVKSFIENKIAQKG